MLWVRLQYIYRTRPLLQPHSRGHFDSIGIWHLPSCQAMEPCKREDPRSTLFQAAKKRKRKRKGGNCTSTLNTLGMLGNSPLQPLPPSTVRTVAKLLLLLDSNLSTTYRSERSYLASCYPTQPNIVFCLFDICVCVPYKRRWRCFEVPNPIIRGLVVVILTPT